jgi:hypothetical protein
VKRFYLLPDGSVRFPTPEENSHFGIAKTELGSNWQGDSEDAYSEMWKRNWVRVAQIGDRVYAEKYVNGPASLDSLTKAQKEWLEDQKFNGKEVFWNDTLFEQTREYKPDRRSIVQKLIDQALRKGRQ